MCWHSAGCSGNDKGPTAPSSFLSLPPHSVFLTAGVQGLCCVRALMLLKGGRPIPMGEGEWSSLKDLH